MSNPFRIGTLLGDDKAASEFRYDAKTGTLSFAPDYPLKKYRGKPVKTKYCPFNGNYVETASIIAGVIRHNDRVVDEGRNPNPAVWLRGTREEQEERADMREKEKQARKELKAHRKASIELKKKIAGAGPYLQAKDAAMESGKWQEIGAIIYQNASTGKIKAYVDRYGFFETEDGLIWHYMSDGSKYIRQFSPASESSKGEATILISARCKPHQESRIGKNRPTFSGMTADEILAARRFIEQQREEKEHELHNDAG